MKEFWIMTSKSSTIMNQLFILLLLTTAITLAMDHNNNVRCKLRPRYKQICKTEKCIKFAEILKSGMNLLINPCDDFYGFMCGSWKEKHPIPNKQSSVTAFDSLVDTVNERVRDIVTNTLMPARFESLKKVRELHKMCMDTVTIDENDAGTILKLLKKIGGWPLIDSKHAIIHTWQAYMKMAYRFNTPHFLYSMRIKQNLKEAHKRIIAIFQPFSGFADCKNTPRQYILVKIYKKYIQDVASYLREKQGENGTIPSMEEDIKHMIEFELKLLKIRTLSQGSMDIPKENENISFEKFQNIYDSNGGDDANAKIDWLELWQLLFKQVGIDIKKSEKIDITNLNYFKLLPPILKITKPRTIVNYMIWTVVRHMINYSGTKLNDIKDTFYNECNVVKKSQQTREEICLKQPNLEKAISFEYVRRYFPEYAKIKSEEIIDHIVKTAGDAVSKIEWMDPLTRSKSVEKVNDIKKLVGYPEHYTAATIDGFYKNFQLGPTYLESILILEKFIGLIELLKYRKPYHRTEWFLEPSKINAYYKHSANALGVTAAFLQPPVFDPDRLIVLNYAVLGTMTAHEVFHSLDLLGHKFDKHGNFVDWWLPKTEKIFMTKLKCFIDQYEKFIIAELSDETTEVCVDAEFTLSENIADSMGLQVSTNALTEYQKETGFENVQLIEFENFTWDQLIFMQFANSHCSHIKREKMEHLYFNDCHALPQARVWGAISNNVHFGKAFKCELNTRMNPSKKCTIL
ncbi:neprilysin-11-like [Prorops nasuta]|uniref:neprilysin-11-like n=1 Tax=Prorops nasuta TaxID=863751 RepID=UPI0034CFD240